jgi:hypothetical protein
MTTVLTQFEGRNVSFSRAVTKCRQRDLYVCAWIRSQGSCRHRMGQRELGHKVRTHLFRAHILMLPMLNSMTVTAPTPGSIGSTRESQHGGSTDSRYRHVTNEEDATGRRTGLGSQTTEGWPHRTGSSSPPQYTVDHSHDLLYMDRGFHTYTSPPGSLQISPEPSDEEDDPRLGRSPNRDEGENGPSTQRRPDQGGQVQQNRNIIWAQQPLRGHAQPVEYGISRHEQNDPMRQTPDTPRQQNENRSRRQDQTNHPDRNNDDRMRQTSDFLRQQSEGRSRWQDWDNHPGRHSNGHRRH